MENNTKEDYKDGLKHSDFEMTQWEAKKLRGAIEKTKNLMPRKQNDYPGFRFGLWRIGFERSRHVQRLTKVKNIVVHKRRPARFYNLAIRNYLTALDKVQASYIYYWNYSNPSDYSWFDIVECVQYEGDETKKKDFFPTSANFWNETDDIECPDTIAFFYPNLRDKVGFMHILRNTSPYIRFSKNMDHLINYFYSPNVNQFYQLNDQQERKF